MHQARPVPGEFQYPSLPQCSLAVPCIDRPRNPHAEVALVLLLENVGASRVAADVINLFLGNDPTITRPQHHGKPILGSRR